MSDSETSSDNLPMKFLENEMKSNKIISSSTDMYHNMISNPAKEKEIVNETSSITKSEGSASSVRSSSSSSSESSRRSRNSSESSGKKSNKSGSSKNSKKHFSPVNIKVTETSTKPSRITVEPEKKKPLTAQETRMRKIELLRKLSEIKQKGFELSKKYDFNSSIEEMEYEYELLKSFANKRQGIKFYKSLILNCAYGLEFMNDKFDPFDIKLSGWSEHMSIEVDSYDDVLEELYEKYKGKGSNMPPEMKLMFLMVASASTFHFTKQYAQNSMIETALKNNPGMVANMMSSKKEESQFMTQQEINLQRQKELAIQRERMERENLKKTATSQNTTAPKLGGFTSNFNPANDMNANPPPRNVSIQAPSNVQDILARLHQSDEQPKSEKKNDRVVSETTMTSDTDKRRGRKKKRNVLSVI